MIKFLNLTALMVLVTYSAIAQKQTIGVLPFSYVSGNVEGSSVYAIQEAVSNGFIKTKRFNIVDRTKMDALRQEKDLQSSEDFIDGSVVAQSKNMGAESLVSGMIVEARTTRNSSTLDDGTVVVNYTAKLDIQLKVIDVETGQIIASESIKPQSTGLLGSVLGLGQDTPEGALTKAIADIESEIDSFISRNFPLTVSIAEVNSKTVLIAAGSALGLEKKDKFQVVEITKMEVDGKILTRKKEIGQVIVKSVDDENFSTCTVKSGADAIAAKFGSQAELKCVSIVK